MTKDPEKCFPVLLLELNGRITFQNNLPVNHLRPQEFELKNGKAL